MKLHELLAILATSDLEEIEVQLIEYDPELNGGQKIEPTFSIYWEHMTNENVLGGHVEISKVLYDTLSLKYPAINKAARHAA